MMRESFSIKGKYNMCIATPDATTPRGEPDLPPGKSVKNGPSLQI
jgi:hypothetical protein